jgi:hypothetical protein
MCEWRSSMARLTCPIIASIAPLGTPASASLVQKECLKIVQNAIHIRHCPHTLPGGLERGNRPRRINRSEPVAMRKHIPVRLQRTESALSWPKGRRAALGRGVGILLVVALRTVGDWLPAWGRNTPSVVTNVAGIARLDKEPSGAGRAVFSTGPVLDDLRHCFTEGLKTVRLMDETPARRVPGRVESPLHSRRY